MAAIILVLSTPAIAEPAKPSGFAVLCKKFSEQAAGLKKTCYYRCGSWEGGMSEDIYERCPHWVARWRLNRNSQFGPSVTSAGPTNRQ